jgi:cell division protein FtsA
MKNSEIVVGLDIGTTKIAVIVGKKNEYGKIEILGYSKTESIGVKRGVVANIEQTVQSIKTAVKEAELKSGVDIGLVSVGIAGQHIKSMQHRGSIMRESLEDEISKEDINKLNESMYKLVMPPGEEIINVIPQDYIIDKEYGIKQPIGMSGICLEANFHIITGQVAAAKNIEKCVSKADLELEKLFLEPIASSEAVLSEEEKEAGVVLVDIGGGTTDIAIFQDNIIRHTAVISFGGDIITEDVKEGCTIIKKQAEALKTQYGSALAKENKPDEYVSIPGLKDRPPKEISLVNLASIIQARMEEIVDHIKYEIKRSGYENKLIAGIVLTGGGSQLKHIAQFTEFATGMDTRIGYPTEHLANNVTKEITHPMFATTVGLVIKGFKEIEEHPKEQKQQKKKKRSSSGILDNFFKTGKKFFEEEDIN